MCASGGCGGTTSLYVCASGRLFDEGVVAQLVLLYVYVCTISSQNQGKNLVS